MVNGAVTTGILARTSSGGTTAWYLTDKLGSVRDIVSTSGTVLDHIVYDSFGNIVTETNASNGDRFKFAGMQYDATTGQYYDHARYYSAATGRFVSQDPMGFAAGDANLYRYVDNSPTNGVDPSGHMHPAIAGGVIGAATGFIVGMTMQGINWWNGGVFDPWAVVYSTGIGGLTGFLTGVGVYVQFPNAGTVVLLFKLARTSTLYAVLLANHGYSGCRCRRTYSALSSGCGRFTAHRRYHSVRFAPQPTVQPPSCRPPGPIIKIYLHHGHL